MVRFVQSANARTGDEKTNRCKLLLTSKRYLHRSEPTLSRDTDIMRLGKLILPRWGTLGREARSTARPSVGEKRRAHRVSASMPVFVYGHSAHSPFAEPTVTANISRTGGLVPLSNNVIRFQKLVVTNLQTNEDAICRVAWFIRNADGHNFVALEFIHPSPHFWAIDFAGGQASQK